MTQVVNVIAVATVFMNYLHLIEKGELIIKTKNTYAGT